MSGLQQRMTAVVERIPVPRLPVSGAVDRRPDDGLARLASTVRLGRGEAIFHEGEESAACYRVLQGCVRLSKLLPDGRRHVLGFAFPGDFIGDTEGDEHDATAEALGPSTLARYPRRQLAAVAERDIGACNLLRRAAMANLAAARARGMVLARLSAAERLASFLLELAGRTGSGKLITLPMTRADIGDHLGLTIETVSRTLTQLKTRGFIRLLGTTSVELTDGRGLAALAHGEARLAA